jgi:hypothetical protein
MTTSTQTWFVLHHWEIVDGNLAWILFYGISNHAGTDILALPSMQ